MSPYTGDVVGLSFDYNTMICQVGYYLYSVRIIMLFFTNWNLSVSEGCGANATKGISFQLI